MQECWAGDPAKRPLLGDVEPRLMRIMECYAKKQLEYKEQWHDDQLNEDDSKVDSAIDAVTTEQCGFIG